MALNRKPKLGHTYETVDGLQRVRIIGSRFGLYEWQGNNGKSYDDEGKQSFFGDEPDDLFRDVTDEVVRIVVERPRTVYVPVATPSDPTHTLARLGVSLIIEGLRAFRR